MKYQKHHRVLFAAGVLLLSAISAKAQNVTLTSTGAYNATAFTNPLAWSDGQAPHTGANYEVLTGANEGLFTPNGSGSYTFGGDSLTMDNYSSLVYTGSGGSTITINDLIMDGGKLAPQGGYIQAGSIDINNGSDGHLTSFDTYGGTGINITAAVSGTGQLHIISDLNGPTARDLGAIVLESSNTYTGGTIVSQYTNLVVDNYVNGGAGSATGTGTVTIQSNGLLGGGNGAIYGSPLPPTGSATLGTYQAGQNGIVGAVDVQSGAILSPGAVSSGVSTQYTNGGVGTITMSSLKLEAGSILNYEFNGLANDFAAVTAANGLDIEGGGFNLFTEGTTNAFDAVGVYNIFDYTGTLSGSLSNLSVLNAQSGFTYTFVDDTADGLIQLDIAAVPEPGTWAMLLVGCAALGFFGWNRRNAGASR